MASRLCSLVFLGWATAGGAWAAQTTSVVTQAPEKKAADAGVVDANDCKTCHEPVFSNSFVHSKHAGLEQSCQSCHAGAADHAKGRMEGKDTPGPSIKKLNAAGANSVCLTCHESRNHATWTGSAHDRRGVTCITCHGVHEFKSARAQLKTTTDSETCFTCHQAMRALSLRTSHHPVREGLMTCASCHNPHDGSKPKMIKAEFTNELCLQCHTEKRGPFLWEHAPVRENCLNCHNPHGSNHDKLLVAKQPYLCQRCHLNTRHPGTFYDNRVAGSTLGLASNRAAEHSCKNCHQYVHGGNAPSGPYLGR